MEMTHSNYINLKDQKLTRKQIADKFSIPEWKLKKEIAKQGWGRKQPSVSNISFFDTYTEASAYWGGFIGADGCVSNDTLQIVLNYDDTPHLVKFKESVGSDHKITSNIDKYYRSSFGFKNHNINNKLKEFYNIIPAKSLVYELPQDIPIDFFRHYLRGYFDGDGCICESFSNIKSTTATLYTTFAGSNKFIPALSDKLYTILGIKGSIQLRDNHSILKYCTNASKDLLHYMYDNSSVYLDRKFNLYNKIIVNKIRMKV